MALTAMFSGLPSAAAQLGSSYGQFSDTLAYVFMIVAVHAAMMAIFAAPVALS